MTALAVILSALAALVWAALEYARRRAKSEAKRVVQRAMLDVLDQAERERAALPDPDKTPTPQEAADALRRYRDAGSR